MAMSAATLILDCPVCHSDGAETLGVTGAMGNSLASTVVMQCDACETVYLSPMNEVRKPDDVLDDQAYSGAIRRAKQSVASNTRFLVAGADEAELLAMNGDASLDQVLLPLTLEGSVDPVALLEHAERLLDDDGVVDIVVANAGSSCFNFFGGRHWYGYRFPCVRRQFTLKSIETLASRSGLRIFKSGQNASAAMWLKSMRNALEDWDTNSVLAFLLAGPWGVPQLLALLLESIASLRGRASLMYVQLRKNGAGHGD